MELHEMLEQEIGRVTTLLSFVIIQPQLMTTLNESIKRREMLMNLIRVRSVKLWAEAMIKEVESKCEKETIKAANKILECADISAS